MVALTQNEIILKSYRQTPNKIMQNQVENKDRNNIFASHEFIKFTVHLVGSLYIFHILLGLTYIYICMYVCMHIYIRRNQEILGR